MPAFVGNLLVGIRKFLKRIDLPGLINKIGPGGAYFRYALGVLIAIGVITAGLISALLIPGIRNIFVKPTPTPQANIPRPPVLPLAKGFQSWDISYGSGTTGPKVKTATVDTLTPPKGGTQTSNLIITNDSPVLSATATVFTDNEYHTYDMHLTQGTATNGTWTGTWRISDTFDYTYHINYLFHSATGDSDLALTFR